MLCLQKSTQAWSQRRKITAPPSWPHAWVSLNLAYQTWSVNEPSKKSKLRVSIRWLKCKHHKALFFLSSFVHFFRRGICHHLWKWHRWIRSLKRIVKLLGSLFYWCSVLSLNGSRLLLDVKWGLIFKISVGITFTSLGIFLHPQCRNAAEPSLVRSLWVALALTTPPRTYAGYSTDSAADCQEYMM